MNCNQARTMFAAYRELKHGQADTTALDVHLEQCAACRQVLAQQRFVGERVRQLPSVEPAPDAHTRLMQALAAEHSRFLQQPSDSRTLSAPSIPDFLKPYVKEYVQPVPRASDALAAFSTAETGPLPIIQRKQKRRVSPTGQFAILGLAATFLMALLVSGMVSLLLLANHNLSGGSGLTSVAPPSEVALATYTAQTSYPNVVSAVANREHIYYSGYGDSAKQWMIEQVDGTQKTAISTPLLSKESANPLFVLASSQDWLIWLQFDSPQTIQSSNQKKHPTDTTQTRTWSLYALFLGVEQTAVHPLGEPIVLSSGTFNASTVPSWVHTPVQGLSFVGQDTLLVTTLDEKGNSQLLSYQLDSQHNQQSTTFTTIATTGAGHILTSPTATDDDMLMYWSEEWLADDTMHGNIWMQQTSTVEKREHGRLHSIQVSEKSLFRQDEMSFHPQVVNNMLFLLSTSDPATITQATPDVTSTSTPHAITPTATLTSVPTTTATTRVDPTSYVSQRDEDIHGTILAFSLDDPSAPTAVLSEFGGAVAPQGGTRFLLWQSDKGYALYDAVAKSPVTIGLNVVSKDTVFLAVNGETAVWVTPVTSTPGTGATTPTVAFNFFNWPKG